jgi:hypothetical protein
MSHKHPDQNKFLKRTKDWRLQRISHPKAYERAFNITHQENPN